jgi:hypothetical protein
MLLNLDHNGSLALLEELSQKGVDLKQFIRQVIGGLRKKMLVVISTDGDYKPYILAINKLLRVQQKVDT